MKKRGQNVLSSQGGALELGVRLYSKGNEELKTYVEYPRELYAVYIESQGE